MVVVVEEEEEAAAVEVLLTRCVLVDRAFPATALSSPRQDGDEPAASEGAPYEDATTYVWGTNVNISDATQRFRTFLTNFETEPEQPFPFYVQKLQEIKQREVRARRAFLCGVRAGS